MRAITKIGSLGIFLASVLFANNADATLQPMLESSYHDGFVFYDEDGLNGRIDFAVYDTLHPVYGDEYLDNGLEKPGTGRYIYAYQIFNDYLASEDPIAYFAIFGIDGVVIDKSTIDSIGSQEDPQKGVQPSDQYFDEDDSRVVWEFNGGDGYIITGEHSWFLIFSSTQDWIEGSYEIKGPEEDQFPVPVPEPATIALLGLGSTMIFTRKRRRRPV